MTRRLVRDWMTRDPIGLGPGEPLVRALEVMAERQIRHVLVREGPRLLGILSSRDVVRGALARPDRRLELHETTLAQVMTRQPLEVVAPDESVAQAAARMRERRVSALPVLEGGALVGIITTDDLLATLAQPDAQPRRPDL